MAETKYTCDLTLKEGANTKIYLPRTAWSNILDKPSTFTATAHTLVGGHTAVGLTTGHYLKATSATTFEFAALPTVSNQVTGTGTTDTIAYWSGASTVASLGVATYPSLTELKFVKGVTSALQTQLSGKEPTISAGTTSQYWRGDKTWQTLTIPSLTGYASETWVTNKGYITDVAYATATVKGTVRVEVSGTTLKIFTQA